MNKFLGRKKKCFKVIFVITIKKIYIKIHFKNIIETLVGHLNYNKVSSRLNYKNPNMY